MSAAAKLPFACPVPELVNATAVSILEYAKPVNKLMLQWIQDQELCLIMRLEMSRGPHEIISG
jgi:hypothetical protein